MTKGACSLDKVSLIATLASLSWREGDSHLEQGFG